MMIEKIYRSGFVMCLLLVFLPAPWGTTAAEVRLSPVVDVTGGYDDNVFYTRTDPQSDYMAGVRPGFVLDYDSELFNVRSSGSVDFLIYLHNSSLDRENYHLIFDGGVNLTERWNLRGNFSFVNDTTLDSQLEETGIVTLRTDRKRYNGGGDLIYRLSELSSAGVGYNHQSTRYGSDLYENYDYDVVRPFWDYQFNHGLDRFTVAPYYGRWRSDISNVDNFGITFGLSHAFSETLHLEAFAGPRYIETETTFTVTGKEVKTKGSNWGGTANIELKKKWTVSTVSLGYNHDLKFSSTAGDDAEPINVDRIFCSASLQIARRLKAGFSGSFYISESAGDFGNQDKRYLYLSPSLDYQLTKNYSLRLIYRYSREFDKRLETDPDQDRNRVWITFTGQWPFIW